MVFKRVFRSSREGLASRLKASFSRVFLRFPLARNRWAWLMSRLAVMVFFVFFGVLPFLKGEEGGEDEKPEAKNLYSWGVSRGKEGEGASIEGDESDPWGSCHVLFSIRLCLGFF